MKKRNKPSIIGYIDTHIIKRLRIYMIVLLVMLIIIVFEIFQGTFSIPLVIVGILTGMMLGIIVSRMYRLSWDEENNNVIDSMDWIGAVILVFYLIFIFTRASLLENWVQGAPLMAIILSLTAGTMLTRVLITRRGVAKILRAWKIMDKADSS